MKLKTINDGNTLYQLIQTNQFKTIHIQVRFIDKIDKSTVTARSIMLNMLKAKNQQYTTRKALSKAFGSLYDMGFYAHASKIGVQHLNQLSFHCVNPSMISDPHYLDSVFSMIETVIHRPLFDAQTLKEEKQFLKDYFAAEYTNKTRYAAKRYQTHLFQEHPYNIHAWGIEEAIDDVTMDDIINAYQTMINNNGVIVSIVGDSIDETILTKLKDRLHVNAISLPKTYLYKHQYQPIQAVKETMQVTQDRLFMTLDTQSFYGESDYYTAIIFNTLLGDSSDSLLFKRVRESLSLAYYIGSSYSPFSGIITITSGMRASNIDQAKAEIIKQLDALQVGDFDISKLALAKTNLVTNLKISYDNPNSLASKAVQHSLLNSVFNEQEVIERISKVTAEDITAFAKKSKFIFTYVLGSDTDENLRI